MSTKLEELQAEIDRLKKEFQSESQRVFRETVNQIFEKYPQLDGFGWSQWTPYFNDGDECVFRVNPDAWIGRDGAKIGDGVSLKVTDYDFWSDEYEGFEDLDIEEPEWADEAIYDAALLIVSIDPNVLKDTFGDHVSVQILRDGTVNIDTAEHD